jgi:hypothetical protein
MEEEAESKNCYYCIDETVCPTCQTTYHPLETDYCFRKSCKGQKKLPHKEYTLPKECENRSCIFYKLKEQAEKVKNTSRRLDFENGNCVQS